MEIKRNILVVIVILMLLPMHQLLAVVAGGGGGIVNPLGDKTLTDLLIQLVNFLLGLVAILALLGIVFGGFRMVLSFGNDQALASAKKILLWSIVGLTISVLSYSILNIVLVKVLGW